MRRSIGLVAISLLIGAGGCASTQEAKSVEKSGFLGDYSRLHEGERTMFKQGAEDQALLLYKNPAAKWGQYKKVMLDPVTVWLGKDSQLNDVSVEDRKMLANLLWSKLDESLRQDYEMTSQSGPDVMHIQAAITEGDKSAVVLDTISSVYLPMQALAELKGLATGVSMFTGAASVEGRITDSATSTILGEFVDRRGGTKTLGGLFTSWHDVEEAYRFWGEKLRYRLCQFREGVNCVEPNAGRGI